MTRHSDSRQETPQLAATNSTVALYLRHTSGSVYQYQGTGNSWPAIDENPEDLQIVASTQAVYLRHGNGRIYVYRGGQSWFEIRADDGRVTTMVAGSRGMYLLLDQNEILMYLGAPYYWRSLGVPSSNISQVAVGASTVFALSERSGIYQYTYSPTPFWKNIDTVSGTSVAIIQIVADDSENLYELREGDSAKQICQYVDNQWVTLAGGSTSKATQKIAANAGLLCRLLVDGSIDKYNPALKSWETIKYPDTVITMDVTIDITGLVYCVNGNGTILQWNPSSTKDYKWGALDSNPLNAGAGNLVTVLGLGA